MGGSWRQKKTIVEDCVILDMKMMARKRVIMADRRTGGTITWTTNEGGTSALSWECDHGRSVVLRYQFGSKNYEHAIPLTYTLTKPFGGRQCWFLCPATDFDFRRGQTIVCNKRVGKLYLPPGSTTFACRNCYNLTYRSCQTSHCREPQLPSWLSFLT